VLGRLRLGYEDIDVVLEPVSPGMPRAMTSMEVQLHCPNELKKVLAQFEAPKQNHVGCEDDEDLEIEQNEDEEGELREA
jgi:hypothetical protein